MKSELEIILSLDSMRAENISAAAVLCDEVSIFEYSHLVTTDDEGREIWTAALQAAIDEHSSVVIPRSETPYFIDKTIVVPSNRRILADTAAHIKKVPRMKTLLMRNLHVHDGTHARISGDDRDSNISISGGIWEDTDPARELHHGLFDEENSMPGINACFFFNNLEKLNLSDLKIIQAGGFGIQAGYLDGGIIENIVFERTVADGVHLNGHTRNVIVKNISGSVADDIVAFNMYDWQRSSVCFGAIENVLCEDIFLAPESNYKAIRILPGTYFYDDGTMEDCAINDVIIRRVRGVNTFKFYFQSPPYNIHGAREGGESGRGDNVIIDDVEICLDRPIDSLEEYVNGDEILGTFAAFELGSQLGTVTLRNIKISLDKQRLPMAYLACVGPKSIRRGDIEIFDPDENPRVERLVLENIEINGKKLTADELSIYTKEIIFDKLYGDESRHSKGRFGEILLK